MTGQSGLCRARWLRDRRRPRAGRDGQDGQATVELVALAPVLVVVVLAVAQLLAAGLAREAAGAAAARAGAPGWAHDRLVVRIDGRRVVVRVAPRALLPGVSGPLTARVTADAGPAA